MPAQAAAAQKNQAGSGPTDSCGRLAVEVAGEGQRPNDSDSPRPAGSTFVAFQAAAELMIFPYPAAASADRDRYW